MFECQQHSVKAKTRVSQAQYCWHSGSFFIMGATPYIVGCLAVSLTSVHQMPVALPSQWSQSKIFPDIAKSPRRGAKSPQLRTMDTEEAARCPRCPSPVTVLVELRITQSQLRKRFSTRADLRNHSGSFKIVWGLGPIPKVLIGLGCGPNLKIFRSS